MVDPPGLKPSKLLLAKSPIWVRIEVLHMMGMDQSLREVHELKKAFLKSHECNYETP